MNYTSGQTVYIRQTLLINVTGENVTTVDTNIIGTLPIIDVEHPILVDDYYHQYPGLFFNSSQLQTHV